MGAQRREPWLFATGPRSARAGVYVALALSATVALPGTLARGSRSLATAALMTSADHAAHGPPGLKREDAAADELAAGLVSFDEDDGALVYRMARACAAGGEWAGFWALRDSWGSFAKPSTREVFLSAFIAERQRASEYEKPSRLHPRLLDVLDLGVRDKATNVQNFALRAVSTIALRDLSGDFAAYQAFRARTEGRNANRVLEESVREFVERARRAGPDEAGALADFIDSRGQLLREIPSARAAALDAGWDTVLATWLAGESENAVQAAMRVFSGLTPDQSQLRRVVLPLLSPERRPDIRAWAAATLGDARADWGIDAVSESLRTSFGDPGTLRAILPAYCRALAAIGNPKAIPLLVEAMEAEGSDAGTSTINAYALLPLTGMSPAGGEMNAAFWRQWWAKNRARFPDAASLDIPPPKTDAPAQQKTSGPADMTGMLPPPATLAAGSDEPARTLTVGFDNDQRYILVGLADAPRDGADAAANGAPQPAEFNLLVLIPGGDGSAAFMPLAKALRRALGPTWLVAQAVAPRWNADQFEQVVWPLVKEPFEGARFTTESFADAIVADVSTRAKVRAGGVFVAGFGSGGPAAYASALRTTSPFKGAAVALSPFPMSKFESLRAASAKRFAILHAEGDPLVPLRQSQSAKEWLTRSGAASAELVTFAPATPATHTWPADAPRIIADAVRGLIK